MSIDLSVGLSIWGAVVSTGLALLKIKEVYNNRFKVGTSYVFRSDAEYGNEISIQNLSNTPVLLNYMEVYYRPKGLFSWFKAPKQLWSPEDEMLNDRIEPHSEITFPFFMEIISLGKTEKSMFGFTLLAKKHLRSVSINERITNNLRVIPHAWHFWFGLSSVFTASKLSIVVAWLTP